MPGHIDVETWRRRIRESTISSYHREMGFSILRREGNAEAAIGHLREAVSRQPSHPLGHRLLIDALESAGRTEEAQAARRDAAALCPRFEVVAHCFAALRLTADNDWVGAAAELDKAAATEQSGPEIAACRQFLRVLQKDTGPILPTLTVPDAELADEVASWLLASVRDERQQSLGISHIVSILDWVVALDPGYTARALGEKARLSLSLRADPQSALDATDAWIAVAGDAADAHAIRARALLAVSLSKQDEAAGAAEKALDLDPGCFDARELLWALRRARGQLTAVLADIERFLRNDPITAEHRFVAELNRGMTLHAFGRNREALAVFQSLDQSNPRMPSQLWMVALELASLGDIVRAHGTLDRAGNKPRPAWNRACRALVHVAAGELDAAAAAAEEAAHEAPGSSWELSILARIRDMQGRAGEAEALLRRAIDISPGFLWIQARNQVIDVERLEAAYRRIGFIDSPDWPRKEDAAG